MPKSELGKSVESLGRALESAAGQLFGEKVIGKELAPDQVAISEETDAAMRKAGEEIGRVLHAAGEGLKAHPLDPAAALEEAKAHKDDLIEGEPGLTRLSIGIKHLGGGLFKVAEGVLDTVAPKKKPDAPR
ncbi:MAG: hypothetical protein ACOZNI_15620 [Myxococcota bacterium]